MQVPIGWWLHLDVCSTGSLLRILAGLDPPDGGTVRVHGTVGYHQQLATQSAAAGVATVRATMACSTGRSRRARAAGRRAPGSTRCAPLASTSCCFDEPTNHL